MSTLLAVHSCSSCSPALIRHWTYFLRQEADWNYVVTTIDKPCNIPQGVNEFIIGRDSYLDGAHLPNRLLDTIAKCLEYPWETLIIAEYDVLILHRIRVEAMEHAVAAHDAGQITDTRAYWHNPWVFLREAAIKFVAEGRKVIKEGIGWNTAESSPDVFVGIVCERLQQPIQGNLWKEFSRNSLDCAGDLDRARDAYRNGIDVIHGVKTKEELDYITTGVVSPGAWIG